MYVDVVWMYITLTAFSNNMVMHHMGGPDSAFLNWVYINKIIFTQKTVKIWIPLPKNATHKMNFSA